MGFQVNTLPEYIDQHKTDLLSAAVFGASTIKHLNIQTGVKHAASLNLLSTSAALQKRTCGFESNGTATITQRVLKVGAYKVNISLCEEDLREKFLNTELIARVGENVLPAEQKIAEGFVKDIKRQIENLVWQADSSKLTNPDQFDGLLTIAIADATAVTSSATTARGLVTDVYAAIPVDILDRAVIFMGMDSFRTLLMELTLANLYHYDPKIDAENPEIILPGTTTKVIAVAGLNGTGAIVAADPENLYFGTDGRDDEEEFKLWYSEDHQEFRFVVKFNAGTQIAFPNQVVYYVPAS